MDQSDRRNEKQNLPKKHFFGGMAKKSKMHREGVKTSCSRSRLLGSNPECVEGPARESKRAWRVMCHLIVISPPPPPLAGDPARVLFMTLNAALPGRPSYRAAHRSLDHYQPLCRSEAGCSPSLPAGSTRSPGEGGTPLGRTVRGNPPHRVTKNAIAHRSLLIAAVWRGNRCEA